MKKTQDGRIILANGCGNRLSWEKAVADLMVEYGYKRKELTVHYDGCPYWAVTCSQNDYKGE